MAQPRNRNQANSSWSFWKVLILFGMLFSLYNGCSSLDAGDLTAPAEEATIEQISTNFRPYLNKPVLVKKAVVSSQYYVHSRALLVLRPPEAPEVGGPRILVFSSSLPPPEGTCIEILLVITPIYTSETFNLIIMRDAGIKTVKCPKSITK